MSTKYFCLLIGTLLLIQCALADSSEENNSKASSEEKIDENHLRQHVLKSYLNVIDQTVVSTRKHFEHLINNIETTNKDTGDAKIQEQLTELKGILENANTKTTNNLDEKRNKNHLLMQIGNITKALENENIFEEEKTNPTKLDEDVHKALKEVMNDLDKNVETFVNWTVEEIEKYWKGLTTAEQKEKQKLHDVLTEVKNESSVPKKLVLLDNLFDLNDEIKKNVITW